MAVLSEPTRPTLALPRRRRVSPAVPVSYLVGLVILLNVRHQKRHLVAEPPSSSVIFSGRRRRRWERSFRDSPRPDVELLIVVALPDREHDQEDERRQNPRTV